MADGKMSSMQPSGPTKTEMQEIGSRQSGTPDPELNDVQRVPTKERIGKGDKRRA
jgi:hypothetical protein